MDRSCTHVIHLLISILDFLYDLFIFFFQLNLLGPHWFDKFLSRVIQHHLGYLSNFQQGRARTEWTFASLRITSGSTRNTSSVFKSRRSFIDRSGCISDSINIDSEVSNVECSVVMQVL